MMKLTVVTPAKRILVDVPVDEVLVPGHRGELNLLPGHAPLISTLTTGLVAYRRAGEASWSRLAVSWGYLEVDADGAVNVLAETAETPEELDEQRVHLARNLALEKLNSTELDLDGVEKYLRKIERAEIRSQLAGGSNSTTH